MGIENVISYVTYACFLYYNTYRGLHIDIFNDKAVACRTAVANRLLQFYQKNYKDMDIMSITFLGKEIDLQNMNIAQIHSTLYQYFDEHTICNDDRSEIVFLGVCPFDGFSITKWMICDLFDIFYI